MTAAQRRQTWGSHAPADRKRSAGADYIRAFGEREFVDLGGLTRLAGSWLAPTRRLLWLGGFVHGTGFCCQVYRPLETLPCVRVKIGVGALGSCLLLRLWQCQILPESKHP